MDTTILVLCICAAIILVSVVCWLLVRMKKNPNDRLGKKGEQRVARVLQSYARFKGMKVLNNICLPLYDGLTEIDHILVAPSGILIVETKNWAGEIYADLNSDKWLQVVGEARNYHYNPLHQNKTHIDNVQHLLRKEKVYKVNLDGAVVFTKGKGQVYCPKSAPVYTVKAFKKMLAKKYKEEGSINVERVVSLLESARITDRKTIEEHRKAVNNK